MEKFLREEIGLPTDAAAEFRATHTDSITVAALRTGMALTDVPEARDLLRLWSTVVRYPRPQDRLRWRQRSPASATPRHSSQ